MRFRRKQPPTTQVVISHKATPTVNTTAGTSTRITNTINPVKKNKVPTQTKPKHKIIVKKRIYNEQPYTFKNEDNVQCTYKCFLDGGEHPAVVDPNGTRKWYKMGMLHRENAPAIISPDGEEWYYEGQHHRLDGPAVISEKKGNQYWINGIKQEEEKDIILD